MEQKHNNTRNLTAFVIGPGSSINLSDEAIFITKGCSRSCAAVGRCDGFLCKHCKIKSLPSSERCSGIDGSSLLFPTLNKAATFDKNVNCKVM